MITINGQIAALAVLWNKVERRAKQGEQFRGEAIVASINEMRYAGRRIVDVIDLSSKPASPQTEEKITEHLVIAKAYLINADHDITDAICFTAHRRFSATIERYGLKTVFSCCPDFEKLYPSIQDAHKIIQGSREDRQNRVAEYDRLADDYIPKIIKAYKQIADHPDLVLEEPGAALKRRIVWTKRFALTASIASILGFILTLFTWINPWAQFKTWF